MILVGTGGVHENVPADVYGEAEKYAKVNNMFLLYIFTNFGCRRNKTKCVYIFIFTRTFHSINTFCLVSTAIKANFDNFLLQKNMFEVRSKIITKLTSIKIHY